MKACSLSSEDLRCLVGPSTKIKTPSKSTGWSLLPLEENLFARGGDDENTGISKSMSTGSDSEAYTTAASSREASVDAELNGALSGLRIGDDKPRPRKRLRVLVQDACRLHRYVRDSDISGIVERPERLRAVNMGIAAVWARRGGDAAEAMAAQISNLGLGTSTFDTRRGLLLSESPFEVDLSSDRVSLKSTAVTFVHNESNQPSGLTDKRESAFSDPAYPDQLSAWIAAATSAHEEGRSEVPAHLPQGDLYLCPGTLAAVEGALGTSCAAVDRSISEDATTFAAIRPPGHHCSTASPSGFCLVNNVLCAAAHAYQKHDVDRIIIFDIDLHHGDGTQDICRRINAESEFQARVQSAKTTPRKSVRERPPVSDSEATRPAKRPLKILYTSLHDIESFPCEDGDDDRVANASMRILGGHGHWVCNVHLEPYENESNFHLVRYPAYHAELFKAATTFLQQTAAHPSRTLVFVSAGFDASEYETPYMQRHGRRVPTSFFSRFATEAQAFADQHASNRLVAVLEGGYSDRALLSGVASLLDGFLDHHRATGTDWDAKTLMALERAFDGKSGARGSNTEQWIATANSAFCALEGTTAPAVIGQTTTTPTGPRELRERKVKVTPSADEQTPPRRANGLPKSRPNSQALPKPAVVGSDEDPTITLPPSAPVSTERVDQEQPYSLPPPALGALKLTFKAGGIA